MKGSERFDVVRSYWAAEGEGRLDKVLSHFSEDAEFVSGTMVLRGRESIRTFYQRNMDEYDEILVTPTNSVEEGDEIAVEYTCRMVKKSGDVLDAVGCNVFLVKKGKIHRLRSYFVPI